MHTPTQIPIAGVLSCGSFVTRPVHVYLSWPGNNSGNQSADVQQSLKASAPFVVYVNSSIYREITMSTIPSGLQRKKAARSSGPDLSLQPHIPPTLPSGHLSAKAHLFLLQVMWTHLLKNCNGSKHDLNSINKNQTESKVPEINFHSSISFFSSRPLHPW